MATIASLNVKLAANTAQFERSMASAQNTMSGMKKAGLAVAGVYATVVAKSLAQTAQSAFTLGAAVEETMSKFNRVFGDAAGEMEAFIDDFATIAGLSDTMARDVLATTGAITQGLGFAQDASARFSQAVVQLAGDLASFNNVPVAQTARAIQSALTGERESLKTLGVVIKETEVQQRAFALTGKTVAAELTNQDRAIATMTLITERAGQAVGDLAATSDTAAAKARTLTAQYNNLKEQLSTALMPVLTVAVQGLLNFVNNMRLMVAGFRVEIQRAVTAWHKLPIVGDPEKHAAAVARLTELQIEAKVLMNTLAQSSEASQGLGEIVDVTDLVKPAIGSVTEVSEGLLRGLKALPIEFDHTRFASELTALGLNAMQQSALNAAMAMEKLNAQQKKFSAVTGTLGFLSRFKALSFLGGPLGTITGGLGVLGALKGAFGGQQSFSMEAGGMAPAAAAAGPVIVNINGPGLETLVDTITVQQGRSRDLRRVRRV